METGYVFFILKPGTKKEFIAKVKAVKSVKESRLVIGVFDAVAKVEAESIEELEKIYYNKIDKIADIINCRLHFVACPRTRK